MSYLTPDRRPVGYSLDRNTSEQGYDRESLPRLNGIPRSKFGIPLLALKFIGKKSVVLETEGLGKQNFHGRTAILVNEHTTGAAEMLAGLKLVIDDSVESRSGKVIGITSPRAGDGKTTLAFNLAWSIAQGRGRVVLIDANLWNPCLVRMLAPKGKPRGPVLASEHKVGKQSVISLKSYGFDLLQDQQRPATGHPASMPAAAAMKELLDELRQRYDWVIVDLPPVLDYVEVRTCANLLDGVIMLIRFGRTTMDDLMQALGELTLVQDRLLGAVVNTKQMPARRHP